jgi:hypothetical protein
VKGLSSRTNQFLRFTASLKSPAALWAAALAWSTLPSVSSFLLPTLHGRWQLRPSLFLVHNHLLCTLDAPFEGTVTNRVGHVPRVSWTGRSCHFEANRGVQSSRSGVCRKDAPFSPSRRISVVDARSPSMERSERMNSECDPQLFKVAVRRIGAGKRNLEHGLPGDGRDDIFARSHRLG